MSSSAIPVLWSDDINVDVVSPLAILRAQLDPLRNMTKGLLEAEVESSPIIPSGRIEHRLYLVAPSLAGYRHELLAVSHREDFVYPAFLVTPYLWMEIHVDDDSKAYLKAETEDAFIDLLTQVLRAPEVRSIIHSLLARINESDQSESQKI